MTATRAGASWAGREMGDQKVESCGSGGGARGAGACAGAGEEAARREWVSARLFG